MTIDTGKMEKSLNETLYDMDIGRGNKLIRFNNHKLTI